MRVVCLGTEQVGLEKVRLAIRFRWADATLIDSVSVEDCCDVLGKEQVDLLCYCPGADAADTVPEVCAAVRECSDVPLIVVADSDGDGLMDEVHALDAGADDYVRPGAGLVDVAARVVALVRRIERMSGVPGMGERPLLVDPRNEDVFVRGHRVELTPTERRLLLLLLREEGKVVPHAVLENLWSTSTNPAAMVKRYVQSLRQKLGEASDDGSEWVRNVHGFGYAFTGLYQHEESVQTA